MDDEQPSEWKRVRHLAMEVPAGQLNLSPSMPAPYSSLANNSMDATPEQPSFVTCSTSMRALHPASGYNGYNGVEEIYVCSSRKYKNAPCI